MSRPPIVYLVDDDPSVTRALARLFQAAGLRFATFASAQDFLDEPQIENPSCLVLDLQLPDQSGLDLQKKLNGRTPGLSIVFISGHGDIPTAVEAMRAGAVNFLQKPFENRALLDAIHRALESQRQFCAENEEKLETATRLATLTSREREVFDLVAAGQPNKTIATKLDLSLQTIKLYRSRVMQKLQLKSVADLVRLAEKAGPDLSES
jgi:FixJ family two-component response regulator